MIAKNTLTELGWFVLGGVVGLVVLVAVVWGMTNSRVMPGVKVAGVDVGGMSREEARAALGRKTEEYLLESEYSRATIPVPPEVWRFDVEASVERAMRVGRTTSLDKLARLLVGRTNFPIEVELDKARLDEWITQVEGLVAIAGKEAELEESRGEWQIVNGEDALRLDKDKLQDELLERGTRLSTQALPLPVQQVWMALTQGEQEDVLKLVGELVKKELVVGVGQAEVVLTSGELTSFVALAPDEAGGVSSSTLEDYVQGLATRYNRKPQDARFEFANGRVQEFAPAKDGIEVRVKETAEAMKEALEKLGAGKEKSGQVEAIIALTPPAISTEEVNNLGIVEVIGRGESYYAHSIPNRIYNVGLAAERVNGTLVPPGGEFSFNASVGEISASTGYKTAYVIQNGRTELGDGGGVCQVSTTIFRAAMNAGLPITERYAHAYRVGYYEQNSKPGLDATIFSPSKDLKFKNDTPGYILVQVTNDPKNYHLIFELYGTKDGRVATVSEPRVSGVSPPPPDLYQDDPTLPVGQVKQVDWAAWGARSVFDYKVEREGETIFAKTFTSNYRPWANVYLRGTGGQ